MPLAPDIILLHVGWISLGVSDPFLDIVRDGLGAEFGEKWLDGGEGRGREIPGENSLEGWV